MRGIVIAIGLLTAATGWAQTEWSDTSAGDYTAAETQAPGNNVQGGAITFHATVGDFNAAAGTTVNEDFEGGATGAGGVNTCVEPVSSASNDVCFSPGDLVAGFAITSGNGNGVAALGDGVVGPTSTVVGANEFLTSTILEFTPPVTAVAFDAINGNSPNDVTIELFDGGGASLGSNIATVPGVGTPVFQGFTSTTPVATVVLTGATETGELIDNLIFGETAGAGGGEPTSVPTLSIVGLSVMAALLLFGGILLARKRADA